MRFFLPLFLFLLPVTALAEEGPADDVGTQLDALFTELRDGSVLDADATTARIVELWSVPASPSVALIYDRALIALAEGEDDLAEEFTTHITALAPSFAQGWVLHATVKMRLNKREEAMTAYGKALEAEPRHFVATTALADILNANGDYRAAFDLYQQALKWNPHYPRARDAAASLRDEIFGQEI